MAHNLNKVGDSFGIRVMFRSPKELSKLWPMTDPRKKPGCVKKSIVLSSPSVESESYTEFPVLRYLYVGQTGRRINVRIRGTRDHWVVPRQSTLLCTAMSAVANRYGKTSTL